LYILAGPDNYSLTKAFDEIKGGIGDKAALATSTTVLDGQQVVLEELKQVCEAAPFLVEKRLVIINGLLERFESGSRLRRQRASTSSASQSKTYRPFAEYLVQVPDSTVVVLIEGRITPTNPMLKELSGKAELRSFPLLKDTQLRRWLQERTKEENTSLSPQAVDLLVRYVGSDLWAMNNEIEKLVLFASERRIEEEDVRAVVSSNQQTVVFDLIDAVVEFKADVAEKALEQLLRRGVAPVYLLYMISRQVQRIIRARELENRKRPKKEIQEKLGLVSEFALRKTLEQTGRFSLNRLKAVHNRLLETDLEIKTGKYDAELALNILVAELCRRDKSGVAHSGYRRN